VETETQISETDYNGDIIEARIEQALLRYDYIAYEMQYADYAGKD
jgi:hypothetical protein